MSIPPPISIIILQYNNSQDTIRCLNSVKELDYPNYNVIIVDNGSGINPARSSLAEVLRTRAFGASETSNGIDHINEIQNWIKKESKLNLITYYLLLTTYSNTGYSGGNNLGIQQALKDGADYVFILNPDTTIEKSALTKLVEVAESDPKIGILGPAINENNKTVYGGKIKWLKPTLDHAIRYTQNAKRFYVPGAAMLIKRKVIEKIGLLDERYFLYFEDADYCQRAKRASYNLAVVPEALVYHKPSSSTSSLGAPLLLHYHYRNAHLFNYKNGPLLIKFALPFWSIFIIIKQLIKIILMPARREVSKAILVGVVDFYKNKFGKI